MRLNHVAINVTDLERSVRFYREALGYEAVGSSSLEGPDMAAVMGVPTGTRGTNTFLAGGNAKVQIELVEWHDLRTGSVPAQPGESGIVLLSFWTDAQEIHEIWRRIGDAGGSCATEPLEVEVAGSHLIAFVGADPDGNKFEFIASNREQRSR